MTKRAVLFLGTISLAVVVLLFLIMSLWGSSDNEPKVQNVFKLEVYKTGNGWGYNILRQDKVFIKQEIVPAIQNLVPFSTEENARMVGQLVLEKLKKHQMPTVRIHELDSLKIVY